MQVFAKDLKLGMLKSIEKKTGLKFKKYMQYLLCLEKHERKEN